MSWSAIEADYKAIAAMGQQIKKVLEGAKRLRITSPEGTDFTVELGGRPIFVRAGVVPPGTKGNQAARSSSLPGGSVEVCPPRDHGEREDPRGRGPVRQAGA